MRLHDFKLNYAVFESIGVWKLSLTFLNNNTQWFKFEIRLFYAWFFYNLSFTAKPITKKLILNEDGVKLDVSLTKIPNIGWNCNNKHQISFCRKFVLSKLKNHLNFEFSAEGNYILKDRRFHLVLYFVSPNHRGLSELDLEILKGISLANKYVIVGKADSLLPNEFSSLKKIISAQLDENSIPTYNFRLGANIQCPAIIFSSMQMVENSINGETYGRPYEWGTACSNFNENRRLKIKMYIIFYETSLNL